MKKQLLIFFSILLIAGCQKEFSDTSPPQETQPPPAMTTRSIADGDMIVLGEQLENPYSVTNMQRAANTLAKARYSAYPIDPDRIMSTHLYIKLHPKTHEELDVLKQDTTLILYEYPLDYEILQDGNYYHDPSIPDSLPTYQYTTIDFAFRLKNELHGVEFEVLESLYIPDEYSDKVERPLTRAIPFKDHEVELLVDTSMDLCALEPDEQRPTGGIPGGPNGNITDTDGKWRPQGKITAYDDIVGAQIPLEKVWVRARRWFTTHIGYTDSNGNFSCNGRFKRPANYSIVWESGDWNIRDGNIVQAYYNGPKMTGVWNLDITANKSLRYATIHRAAFRFYYGTTNGLFRPSNTRKENIAYIDGKNDNGKNGDYNRQWGMGIWSDIRIFGKDDDGWRAMSEIFSTTSHELGHTAHYTNTSNIYGDSKKQLRESWARCVQYILTNLEYTKLQVYDRLNTTESITYTENEVEKTEIWMVPNKQYNFQKWNRAVDDIDYTPVFIDLIDDYNQRIYFKHTGASEEYSKNYPDDDIHDFPAYKIEEMVFSSKTIWDVKAKLLNYTNQNSAFAKAQYNMTSETINRLFSVYEN